MVLAKQWNGTVLAVVVAANSIEGEENIADSLADSLSIIGKPAMAAGLTYNGDELADALDALVACACESEEVQEWLRTH